MANALEVINTDPKVQSIFINVFGGITRGEEVANGIVEGISRVDLKAPMVIRLDGTNAEEGRAILAEHESDRLISQPTTSEPAGKRLGVFPAGSTDRFLRTANGRAATALLLACFIGRRGLLLAESPSWEPPQSRDLYLGALLPRRVTRRARSSGGRPRSSAAGS